MKLINKVIILENCKVYYLGKRDVKKAREEVIEGNFYLIKKKRKSIKSINHHILLLDCSFSMINEIEALKERVKMTLTALKSGRNNYVSIIIYSGHNESKRILNAVKCDKTSYDMAEAFKIIEEEVNVKSLTVMSEPLEIAIDIVNNLNPYCNKNHIILFTDGCLVSNNWSIEEEKEKVLTLAKICNEKNIYFNSIGFGKYYDRAFLKELVEKVSTGTFNHIDKVKDYYKTVIEFSKEINSKEILDIKIDNDKYFILNTYSMGERGLLKTVADDEDIVICVFNEELKIKEKITNAKRYKKEKEKIYEKFLYSLSLYYLINEDLEKAQYLLSQTGDIEAYENINNCYSFIELGQAINNLSIKVKDETKRFKKGKKEIQIQSLEEKICLLEVLKEILEDKESSLLWDYKYKYKRIGRKAELVEERYKFLRPSFGYGQVIDVAIGSKKLNVGVLVKIDGQVMDTKTMLKLDSHIFRQYNIISNGNINTEFIWCKLSQDLKKKFRKEKIIKEVNKYNGEEVVVLDLRKLKTTNKRLLKSLSGEEIANCLYEIEKLKCRAWAINKILKELKIEEKNSKKKISLREKIRDEYGVGEDGLYRPLGVGKKESEEYEVYEAKVLEWKIEKFPKKKELDEALKYYNEFKISEPKEAINKLKEELKTIKKEKESLSYKLNIVRLSCGLMESSPFIWEDEKVKEKKEMDKELGRNAIVNSKVNILTKKIKDINLRQDSYKILTKCD